jgi:DNA processing protein
VDITNLLISGFSNIARKYLPPVLESHLCIIGDGGSIDEFQKAFAELVAAPAYSRPLNTIAARYPLANVIAMLRQEVGLLIANGGQVVAFHSPHYPPMLRHIPDPPPCLYAMGSCSRLAAPSTVAVIGARRASPISEQRSRDLGVLLAQLGFVVVSGGAFGCDVAAHAGALSVSAQCAAVVQAGGLRTLYPTAHLGLFARIVKEGGVIISERLFSDQARRFDFPIRNRLIAGMAETTIVIESTVKSGSMTTVAHALTQGRTVLTAAPPDDHDVRFSGNRQLIADGSEVLQFPASGLSEWRGYEKSLLIDNLSR